MKLEEYEKWREAFERKINEMAGLEDGDREILEQFLNTDAGARIVAFLLMINQAKSKQVMTKMTSMENALEHNWWIGNIHGTGLIIETLIGIVVERPDERPIEQQP